MENNNIKSIKDQENEKDKEKDKEKEKKTFFPISDDLKNDSCYY
jgi:hypothetical protein